MEENVEILKIVVSDGCTSVIVNESVYYHPNVKGKKMKYKECYYIEGKPVSNSRKRLLDLIRHRT